MINIRRANLNDASILAKVGWQSFEEAFAEHPKNHPDDMRSYMNKAFSLETISEELYNKDTIYLIAEINRETAGYAKLEFDVREDCVTGKKPVELCRLYALDKFIGKGIGKNLMLEFFKLAENKSCDVAWLGVWEYNFRAQEFYKKFGFEKCGEHIFQLGSDPQTDWIFQKII